MALRLAVAAALLVLTLHAIVSCSAAAFVPTTFQPRSQSLRMGRNLDQELPDAPSPGASATKEEQVGRKGVSGLKIVALSGDDPAVSSCLSIRRAVFIVEQSVPEEIEVDGRDPSATHILATATATASSGDGDGGGGDGDEDEPCGAARLLISDDGLTGKIGRVCVLPSHRRKGVGRAIVLAAVEELRRSFPGCRTAQLGAQVHALSFYEAMGFNLVPGEEYMDAGGVPHRDMEMTL